VLAGLLEAVEQARVQSNPMAMVSGLREIGKMLGFYAPEVKKVDLNVAGQVELKRMNQMSDAELLQIIDRSATSAV
jgi:phage terminase small subunit